MALSCKLRRAGSEESFFVYVLVRLRRRTKTWPFPEPPRRRKLSTVYLPLSTSAEFSSFGVPPPAWRSVLKIGLYGMAPALPRPANDLFPVRYAARCEAGKESFFVDVFVRIRMRTKT